MSQGEVYFLDYTYYFVDELFPLNSSDYIWCKNVVGDWDISPIVSHNKRVEVIFREKILITSGVENILV